MNRLLHMQRPTAIAALPTMRKFGIVKNKRARGSHVARKCLDTPPARHFCGRVNNSGLAKVLESYLTLLEGIHCPLVFYWIPFHLQGTSVVKHQKKAGFKLSLWKAWSPLRSNLELKLIRDCLGAGTKPLPLNQILMLWRSLIADPSIIPVCSGKELPATV